MKAYKYKLRTNARFVAACSATLDLCRELYNAALQERRAAYRINGVSISYNDQTGQLPAIKQVREDLGEVHSQVLQDILRRVDKAFAAFFRRIRKGQNPGYPRFKPASHFHSFTYPQSGFRLEGDKLHLSRIGACRVRLSRPIEGTIKTCTIRQEADGWYVSFAVEENQCPFYPKTGHSVGVDVGIESFATLSSGEQIANLQFLRTAESELKTAQRRVARRKKGSGRRRKAARLLAKKHQKIARRRTDFHHKTALDLVRAFDEIAVEDLNIRGMVRNHHLARSIVDVAWGAFFLILFGKAANAGRRARKVKARYTSQDCARCGAMVRKSLDTRVHSCVSCGFVAHPDHNAALNIKGRAGLSGMVPVGESCEPRISTYSPQA